MNGLMDFLQQTSRTAGQTATGLVDLATLALRPLGYSIPDEKVFGTTKWAEQKGLLAPESQTPAGLAGQTVGNLLFPLGAGKSTQIADGLLTAQANAAAPRVLRKESGMFIGPGAKTWDAQAAKKAQTMAAKGEDPRKIFKETLTYKGVDGMWRQEIDDSAAQVNDPKFWSWGNREGIKSGEAAIGPVDEFMLHGQLRDAYPDGLMNFGPNGGKRMVVRVSPSQTSSASYADGVTPDDWGHINVGLEGSGVNKSSMLHELQHAIQGKEGWALGGSSRMMGDELGKLRQLDDQFNQAFEQFLNTSDDVARANARQQMDYYGKQIEPLRDLRGVLSADEGYARLAGEAEARATQARMNMNMAQRREVFPLDSYDVPIDQLIVRRGLLDGPAMMVADPRKKGAFKGLLGGDPNPVSVGTITDWQTQNIAEAGKYPMPTSNQMIADTNTGEHLLKRKGENFSGDDLWGVLTSGMRKDAKVNLPDFDKKRMYPSLVKKGAVDPVTGKTYDATIPVAIEDGKLVIKTIVPDGLPARKKKTTWP